MTEFFEKVERDAGIVRRRRSTIPAGAAAAAAGAVVVVSVSSAAVTSVQRPQTIEPERQVVAEHVFRPRFVGLLARVMRATQLAAGWDGDGSIPPTVDAQSAATTAVLDFAKAGASVAATPQVAPTNDGGYQFEWHNGERELYVTCAPGGLYEIMECGPGEIPEHAGDRAVLSRALEWFTNA